MNQKLIRLFSEDDIEMPGILYTPENETNKIVLHVHGLNGNFYENKFLDEISKVYTSNNYAFLTFNNRGKDYISELNKKDEQVIIGGCKERFKDCILDINGAVNWAKNNGYEEIVLEGHSYGCNKVIYYYNKKKNSDISGIILLAPCDIPSEVIKFLSEDEYINAKTNSEKFVKNNRPDELIDFSIMANEKIAAATFYYDFLPGGENDFLRYRDGIRGKSKELNNIDVPVIILFGNSDECVLTEPLDVVRSYLLNNIKQCSIKIINEADHSFSNKYKELCKEINDSLKSC